MTNVNSTDLHYRPAAESKRDLTKCASKHSITQYKTILTLFIHLNIWSGTVTLFRPKTTVFQATKILLSPQLAQVRKGEEKELCQLDFFLCALTSLLVVTVSLPEALLHNKSLLLQNKSLLYSRPQMCMAHLHLRKGSVHLRGSGRRRRIFLSRWESW